MQEHSSLLQLQQALRQSLLTLPYPIPFIPTGPNDNSLEKNRFPELPALVLSKGYPQDQLPRLIRPVPYRPEPNPIQVSEVWNETHCSSPPSRPVTSTVPIIPKILEASSSNIHESFHFVHMKEQEEEPEELEDFSIGSETVQCVVKLTGRAAKRRNVYKSILRHILSYISKNKNDFLEILQKAGYSEQALDHAYKIIEKYNDMEIQKGNKKAAQNVMKKMIEKKSIYTYILRETLNSIMMNWRQGNYGRMYKKTLPAYREVCQKYYDEAVNVLSHPAEGRTFFL